jgi:hypothetical protein
LEGAYSSYEGNLNDHILIPELLRLKEFNIPSGKWCMFREMKVINTDLFWKYTEIFEI